MFCYTCHMKIGKPLRELRIAKGISQLELERRSGLISISCFEGVRSAPSELHRGE
jgi:transcriptional regulator with XRE-family HTH domain